MMRVSLAILTFALSATTTTADFDWGDSPLADMRREAGMVMSRAPIAAHYVQPPRRSSRAVNARNYAIAIRAGERVGVPADVTAFHLDKESGGRADARNPASTAKGLGQIIHGTHVAITGQRLTRAEHFRLASDPEHNARVTAAHIRACMDLMPGADARSLWRRCHVQGHGAVGGRVEMARAYFKPDAHGWLQRGSTAQPWAVADLRLGGGA